MAKRILIIDDSPIILAAAKHVLVAAGYDVETRSTVTELGEKGAANFDLILMDVQMPELFGDDIAAVLRHERDIQTPIYLFSTLPVAELKRRAADARIDGYISKESGMKTLVAEVQKILGA